MAAIFFEGTDISQLVEEFVKEGNFTYDTISQVFGSAPVIPDSPDMDTRLDAWNEKAAYASKIQRCEAYVRSLITKAEANILAGGG